MSQRSSRRSRRRARRPAARAAVASSGSSPGAIRKRGPVTGVNGTLTWSFPKDGWSTYSFSADSGNPANFNNWTGQTWGPTTAGTLHDKLDSEQLNVSRKLNWGDLNKLKFGLRATQREKHYEQTSWDYNWAQFNTADLKRVSVSGRPDFVAFPNVEDAITQLFGAATLSAAGRTPTTSDLVTKDWRAKERSTAAFVQGDLNGTVAVLTLASVLIFEQFSKIDVVAPVMPLD